MRSFTTQPAATTRPSVLKRLLITTLMTLITLPITTPRSVLVHSLATQGATPTRPPVIMRSLATQAAAPTQPTVLLRSLATQPAAATRPTVVLRSVATQPAAATS